MIFSNLKNKIIKMIENKLIQYKLMDELEKHNQQLAILKQEALDELYIFNPQIANYNTPFELINFEDVTKIKIVEDLLIVHTPYELYTLRIKSDEYFFSFIKKLIVVGEKTLIGTELLLLKSRYYDLKINLTKEVDVTNIRNLVYQYHDIPVTKHKENAVYNSVLVDYSKKDMDEKLAIRYGEYK